MGNILALLTPLALDQAFKNVRDAYVLFLKALILLIKVVDGIFLSCSSHFSFKATKPH